MHLAWQPSLLDGGAIEADASFRGLTRRELGDGAWVDHVPGWCRGADSLFERLLREVPWRGRDVRMYDRTVTEPRLTHRWHAGEEPAPPAELQDMALLLGARYGIEFSHNECCQAAIISG